MDVLGWGICGFALFLKIMCLTFIPFCKTKEYPVFIGKHA